MTTMEQFKIIFFTKDVSQNLTKSYQVSISSFDYSRSSRRKIEGGGGAESPAKQRVLKQRGEIQTREVNSTAIKKFPRKLF